MRVIDTSVLVAWADASEADHPDALFALSLPQPIRLPFGILVESFNVIARRGGLEAGRAFVRSLLRLGHMSVTADPDPAGAIDRLLVPGSTLSLADAAVVRAAQRWGAEVLSFDHEVTAMAERLRSGQGGPT